MILRPHISRQDSSFFAFCNVVSSLFLQTVKELEKAIVSSPLGLNPKLDGQRLIASIPPYDIQFSLSLSLSLSF